jgi:hypothetical protein
VPGKLRSPFDSGVWYHTDTLGGSNARPRRGPPRRGVAGGGGASGVPGGAGVPQRRGLRGRTHNPRRDYAGRHLPAGLPGRRPLGAPPRRLSGVHQLPLSPILSLLGAPHRRALAAAFPTLPSTVHRFDARLVRGKISSSVRRALDQPLNYARIYLADLLPRSVSRVLYLDSDLLVVDDVAHLWVTDLGPDAALAAPEYCHANFTSYFTDAFWQHPEYASVFANRTRAPCYFNTGVMVIDLDRWRAGGYTAKLEYWMEVQKQEARIYELGSLPPFLLVFAGEVKAVEHRWNQHGLGGDNVAGQCRELHPGPVSLLHWSGKGKPWLRLDAGRACPLDALWAPYDLRRRRGAREDLLAAVA